MKKLLIRGLIAVVILIVLVVVGIAFSLNSAIKKGIETVGPQVTKVDVKLAGVNLSLLSGSGSIKGLVIGNPPGYSTPHSISVGNTSLAIQPGSVFSDKVVVKSVRIESPEINYEGDVLTDNLRTILKNMTSGSGGGSNTNAPAGGSSGPGKKLQVNDFVITGAKVNVVLKGVVNVNEGGVIPDIHLTNLGQGPEGITSEELSRLALEKLINEAVKYAVNKGTDIGKDALKKAADEGLKKATDSLGDLLNKKK